MPTVLLVHNHSLYRAAIKLLLVYELGLRVVEAADISTALLYMRRESVDLIIQGVDIPGRTTGRLLAQIRQHHPHLPVLVLMPLSHRTIRKVRRPGVYILDPATGKPAFLDIVCTLLPALPQVSAGCAADVSPKTAAIPPLC